MNAPVHIQTLLADNAPARLRDADVDVLGGAFTQARGDKILPDQYPAGVNSFTYAAGSAIDPGTATCGFSGIASASWPISRT